MQKNREQDEKLEYFCGTNGVRGCVLGATRSREVEKRHLRNMGTLTEVLRSWRTNHQSLFPVKQIFLQSLALDLRSKASDIQQYAIVSNKGQVSMNLEQMSPVSVFSIQIRQYEDMAFWSPLGVTAPDQRPRKGSIRSKASDTRYTSGLSKSSHGTTNYNI